MQIAQGFNTAYDVLLVFVDFITSLN